MIELGKWYKYDGDVSGNWDILPLGIYNGLIYSLDIEIQNEAADPNIRIDNEELSWYTKQLGTSLTLSKAAPSFILDNEQKAKIFKTIFGNRE